MKTVWKYVFSNAEEINKHIMPIGAKPVFIGRQDGVFCAWFEVDTENPRESVSFKVFGTGHETKGTHIGTWQEPPFVWHLYRIN